MKIKGYEKKRPEICLSLNCNSLDEIREQIEEFKDSCQIVEWCVDKTSYTDSMTEQEYIMTLKQIKSWCHGKKMIVDCSNDDKFGNTIRRWSMGYVDFIDIDANNPSLSRLIREAKRKKTKVIISFHNYDRMMTRDEIAEKLVKMEKTGAHILKIACMAQKESDNYAMLEGAAAYSQLRNHRPIVAIAMGEEGQTSRVCAGDFGSVISYACGSKPTAPGQFNARELSKYLDIYYGEK